MTIQTTNAFFQFLTLTGVVMLTGCNDPHKTARNEPEVQGSPVPGAFTEEKKSDHLANKVIVYYFHGTRRCSTCLGIQKAIEQTIKERFGAETASGKLIFNDVNIDEDANKHFIKEYQVSFSSMIVSVQTSGKTVKWENATKTWDYAHNPAALKDYTEKTVRTYLALLKRS